jgi:hypothetical protein
MCNKVSKRGFFLLCYSIDTMMFGLVAIPLDPLRPGHASTPPAPIDLGIGKPWQAWAHGIGLGPGGLVKQIIR